MTPYTLTADERELLISITDAETELCITSSSPVWNRRLEKLARDLDREIIHLNEHTIRCYVPRACLTLRLPPQPRRLTDAQREAARQRMQTLRASAPA
jgi:hypothetical protein